MSRDNIFDIASDELKSRLDMAYGELRNQFKGTHPYRKDPLSPAEQLYNFNQIPPDVREQLRAQMGGTYSQYEQKMLKIQERYNGRT